MKTYVSSSESDTSRIAREFARKLKGGDVVAFTGGLGAGKTFFTAEAVSELGVGEYVTSPTFAICNDYGQTSSGLHVYHFDMYRVLSEDSLYSTGYYDYLNDSAVLFIEWSENVAGYLPEDRITVAIETTGDSSRIITIESGDGRW